MYMCEANVVMKSAVLYLLATISRTLAHQSDGSGYRVQPSQSSSANICTVNVCHVRHYAIVGHFHRLGGDVIRKKRRARWYSQTCWSSHSMLYHGFRRVSISHRCAKAVTPNKCLVVDISILDKFKKRLFRPLWLSPQFHVTCAAQQRFTFADSSPIV